jgi:hypothetical protein
VVVLLRLNKFGIAKYKDYSVTELPILFCRYFGREEQICIRDGARRLGIPLRLVMSL